MEGHEVRDTAYLKWTGGTYDDENTLDIFVNPPPAAEHRATGQAWPDFRGGWGEKKL